MGLFSSTPKVTAQYDDLRTNVLRVTIEDGRIYALFHGRHQDELDRIAQEKEEKEYKKNHGFLSSIFHSSDAKAKMSKLAFRGEDILDFVVIQESAKQIAPDAFSMKAFIDNTDVLHDSLDSLNEELYELKSAHADGDDKEREERMKRLRDEIQRTKDEIRNNREVRSNARSRLKKGDQKVLEQFKDVIVYVTPMGLSLYEWERFTDLPALDQKERERVLHFDKIPSRVHCVALKSRYEGKDDDDASDDYTSDLIAYVSPGLEFAVDGYFKNRSLKVIDKTSFSVVDYVTGEEVVYYIGVHDITDDPELAWDKYHVNPNNLHWYSETKHS